MDLKQQVDKLRQNPLFSKIYAKHRQRRVRSKGKISLERTQLNALKEFLQTFEQETTNTKTLETDNDYYILVAGKSMLNSEWKRLIQTQKELGDVLVNPSPNWELRHIHYLKSLFRKDEKPHKDKSVDLW
jgi:hypothetical protein